jgi:hypothetical protein
LELTSKEFKNVFIFDLWPKCHCQTEVDLLILDCNSVSEVVINFILFMNDRYNTFYVNQSWYHFILKSREATSFPIIILDLVYEVGKTLILIMFGSLCQKYFILLQRCRKHKSGHSDLCTLYVLVI